MIINPKVGDTAFFIDWDGTCSEGTISSLFKIDDSDYANVDTEYVKGCRGFSIEKLYSTRKQCMQVIDHNSKLLQQEYSSSIKSLNDLIRFMYKHNFQGEYADCNAKAVVKKKAKELLEMELID